MPFDPALPMAPDQPENPWGNNKPSPGKTPWNNGQPTGQSWDRAKKSGGFGGGGLPPVLDPIHNFFNSDNHTRLIALAVFAVFILWLAGGLYRVQPKENAVILRFGQFTETVRQSGLHYHLPWPFETVIKENVTFERRIEVGYRGTQVQGMDKQDVPEESMILTGDANIVDLDFVVQWNIADAKQYLFNIRDPDFTLKRVAESAMREVIGQNLLQDIITDRREDIAAQVKKLMQDVLNSYGSGIMVTQVLIQDASVPPPVLEAFEDVVRATQQAETMRNQALKYRNEIVPQAQGNAIRFVKEAEAYQSQVVSLAQGDAQRFSDVYNAYIQSKQTTRDRLYIEAWERILANGNIIILDKAGGNGAVPYLNLNELQKKSVSDMEKN